MEMTLVITNGYELETPGSGAQLITDNFARIHLSNSTASGVAQLEFDVDDRGLMLWIDEHNPSNPYMLGARVELYSDYGGANQLRWFKGNIEQDPVKVDYPFSAVRFTCFDRKGRVSKAHAPNPTGLFTWVMISPKIQLTRHRLLQSMGYSGNFRYIYFPEPYPGGGALSNAWFLGAVSTVQSDLGGSIQLNTGAVDPGFPMRGFVQVGTEIIYYDGIFYDGFHYHLYNCVRGELGTIHIAWPDFPIVTFVTVLTPKMTAPNAELIEQVGDGQSYNPVTVTKYGRMPDLGAWEFNIQWWDNISDPTGVFTPRMDFYGTYQIYDETSGSVLTLNDILFALVSAPAFDGGAGFVAGEYNNALGTHNVAVNLYRYRLQEMEGRVQRVIDNLLTALQLDMNVLIKYDSENAKLNVEWLTQHVVPDFIITDGRSIDFDRSTDEIYKIVNVIYEIEKAYNSLHEFRMWHPAPWGKKTAPSTGNPNYRAHPDTWGDLGYVYPADQNVTDELRFNTTLPGYIYPLWNAGFTKHSCDDNQDSTMTAWFNRERVHEDEIPKPWHGLYMWFGYDPAHPTTCPIMSLDEFKIVIGAWRRGTVTITIEGTDQGNPSNPEDPAIDWFSISPELDRVGGSAGDTDDRFTFSSTKFVYPNVNMLRVTWWDIPTTGDGDSLATIREIFCRASMKRVQPIRLTADPTKQFNNQYVYAPNAYKKLYDIIATEKLDVGIATENEAITIGRAELLKVLRFFEMKYCLYLGDWIQGFTPQIGMTARIPDKLAGTYKGILHELDFEKIRDQGQKFIFGIKNENAPLIS